MLNGGHTDVLVVCWLNALFTSDHKFLHKFNYKLHNLLGRFNINFCVVIQQAVAEKKKNIPPPYLH
uniref:Uncharacterized protein n=1 Tax=Arion vulgaris TaxID=1028688 RepID=A0A0B7AX15_9EUPU